MGSVALAEQLAEQLRGRGLNPYIIPVGGSSPLGTWGYIEAAREVQEQAQPLGITDLAMVRCLRPIRLLMPECTPCTCCWGSKPTRGLYSMQAWPTAVRARESAETLMGAGVRQRRHHRRPWPGPPLGQVWHQGACLRRVRRPRLLLRLL